jgi:hypothetical protein
VAFNPFLTNVQHHGFIGGYTPGCQADKIMIIGMMTQNVIDVLADYFGAFSAEQAAAVFVDV